MLVKEKEKTNKKDSAQYDVIDVGRSSSTTQRTHVRHIIISQTPQPWIHPSSFFLIILALFLVIFVYYSPFRVTDFETGAQCLVYDSQFPGDPLRNWRAVQS